MLKMQPTLEARPCFSLIWFALGARVEFLLVWFGGLQGFGNRMPVRPKLETYRNLS